MRKLFILFKISKLERVTFFYFSGPLYLILKKSMLEGYLILTAFSENLIPWNSLLLFIVVNPNDLSKLWQSDNYYGRNLLIYWFSLKFFLLAVHISPVHLVLDLESLHLILSLYFFSKMQKKLKGMVWSCT